MILNYILSGFLLTWLIPLIGFIIHIIINLFYKIIVFLLGNKVTYFLFNYFLFLGIIHHELSHFIFAKLTGTLVLKVDLFKPTEKSLGSVLVCYTGSKLKQSIQATLVSVAPIICGIISVFCLYNFLKYLDLSTSSNVVLYYILFSIVIHMTMSKEDLKSYKTGSFVLTILLSIVCYIAKFSLV